MNPFPKILSPSQTQEEWSNMLTHFLGVVLALSGVWMLWPAFQTSWQLGLGVAFFVAGMALMYAASTLYHWALPGKVKRLLRKFDHIGIYVMIACSYTPICIGVVGGWLGWLVFGLLWMVVVGGAVYKLVAIDRWPRLSLAIYLLMGWSGVFIAGPVWEGMSTLALLLLLLEGLAYTGGTYFFAHDHRPHYHAIWHFCVLLGSLAHWGVVLCVLFD